MELAPKGIVDKPPTRRPLIESLLLRPDIQTQFSGSEEGQIDWVDFEFKDKRGREFCVTYLRTALPVSPYQTSAWELDHVNKWVDHSLPKQSEDKPWPSSVAEAEQSLHGYTVTDFLVHVLKREQSRRQRGRDIWKA